MTVLYPVDVLRADCFEACASMRDVPLVIVDPPYGGIVDQEWDRVWTAANYGRLGLLVEGMLAEGGTAYVWGGVGKPGRVFERLGTAIFPTTRPPSLDDVPTGLPKVEPGSAAVHTSRGKPRVPPLLAQDEINDHAARERVCGPCVRPGEQVFGKSLRASSDACPRCKRPCAQGFVVRGEVRHVAPDPRTQRRAFVCPCGLNAKQRRVQKHVCPAVRTKGAA